jgi:hypothetical protein
VFPIGVVRHQKVKNVHLVGVMNGVYVDLKKCMGWIILRRLLTELHYINVCINK